MSAVVKMSEADLQQAVIDLARLLGYMVAHFRPARIGRGDDQRWVTPVAADGKGFPDLVLAHPRHGVIFAELKSAKGRTTSHQDEWIRCLDLAGAHATVWRPDDWTSGHIERVLRGGE